MNDWTAMNTDPMENDSQTVRARVIGLGAIGSRVALSLVRAGVNVVGIDVNKQRLSDLSNGFGDEVVMELASYVGRQLRLADSYDNEAFDVSIICVSTWDAALGLSSSNVQRVLEVLSAHLSDQELVTIESSVPPGSTEREFHPLVESLSGRVVGKDVFLAFSPERLDVAIDMSLAEVPKIVGGATPACAKEAIRFYESVGVPVVSVSSATAAEATKLLENAYRLVNIAFANEVADVFAHLGLDPKEIVQAATTKPFGFQSFWPSAGAGGHCIPAAGRALQSLAISLDQTESIITAAVNSNVASPLRIEMALMRKGLKPGGSVLILGCGYKGNASETCESPGLRLAQHLDGRGYVVVACDSLVDPSCTEVSIVSADAMHATEFDVTCIVAWQPTFLQLAYRGVTFGEVLDVSGSPSWHEHNLTAPDV